jgi:predicted DNA-binding transcriptional regulator AlpA
MNRSSISKLNPVTATTAELEKYLGIKCDKRRELFASWGFHCNRSTTWSEIWSAIGLKAEQPKTLWADLQMPLLDNKAVSEITGTSVGTINSWCKDGKYPILFPHPIRLGPRTKLWIPLEVLGFVKPVIYIARAQKIRRASRTSIAMIRQVPASKIDLEPLPKTTLSKKIASSFDKSANLTEAEQLARNRMLQTTEELIAKLTRKKETTASSETATMNRVIEMLTSEIDCGLPPSSRRRAQCALRSLLSAYDHTPDTFELSIDQFDRTFPRTGWNPVNMPTMSQSTYLDYRKRARGSLKKALGVSEQKSELRSRIDGWSTANEWLMCLPSTKNHRSELSSITSTLTMLAREIGVQPHTLTQTALNALYSEASTRQRKSLRNAARLIQRLQRGDATADRMRKLFPHAIAAIQTTSDRHFNIPSHFQNEIDEMTNISTRIKYSKIKKSWSYLSNGTRKSHRSALRCIVNALIAVGQLRRDANTIKSALSDLDAVCEALRYVVSRVESGALKASTSATMAGYLPPILERNGIFNPELRKEIEAVQEFTLTIKNSKMSAETKAFCRSLIERLDLRTDFLLSHVPLRREAEAILRTAKKMKRGLTRNERTKVRQLGATALFCAIECGGAPVRIENFLETTVTGCDAWLTIQSSSEFRLTIPASKTKNKKHICAPILASEERYHDTIKWFLASVRPHFFRDDVSIDLAEDERNASKAKVAALRCVWLVPGVKDPQKGACYTTFLGWFQRLMRDVVGVACDPHNFRHGQASLLFHEYPERMDMISQRLGDSMATVVEYYAWIHDELLMREGQEALVAMLPKRSKT